MDVSNLGTGGQVSLPPSLGAARTYCNNKGAGGGTGRFPQTFSGARVVTSYNNDTTTSTHLLATRPVAYRTTTSTHHHQVVRIHT